MYRSAEQREKLVESERKFVDERVKQIIDLKRKVKKAELPIIAHDATFCQGLRYSRQAFCGYQPKRH